MEPLAEVDVWPVIDRYLAGEASEHEIEVVRAWLAADPARADLLAELRRVRELARDRPPARSTNAAWGAVARAVGITSARGRTTRVTLGRAPATDRSSWIAAAAIVFVLAGGATALSVLTSPKAPQAAVTSSAPRVYVTQRGQRAEVHLDDGTRVTLAPASRLEVPADFGIARRDVIVEGRAMLTVVHDDVKPFTVHARRAIVRDVGTRFAVTAYPEDADVEVVVAEGIVQLRDSGAAEGSGVVMKRGAVGRVSATGRTAVVEGADIRRLTAWTDGSLEFDRTPVPEAVAELARWFDLDVRIADSSLVRRRVTATLRDQPLPDILELFAMGLGARIERSGRKVVLHALDPSPTR